MLGPRSTGLDPRTTVLGPTSTGLGPRPTGFGPYVQLGWLQSFLIVCAYKNRPMLKSTGLRFK